MRWSALVDEVVARTPADRDRVVDLLRVASILVVVAGHWLLAVVTVQDGAIVGDNLLAIVPATQWLTWGLQVMPVFFFVGGRVNGAGWSAAQARGSSAAAWIQRRADRLLRPVLVLVAVWTVLVVVLAVLGVGPDLLRLGSQIVLTPVWFLAVYLGVVALVPLTYAAHRRWPLGTIVTFVMVAITVDAARRAGVPAVGWANYLAVWGGVHQLGYLWGDRRVATPRTGLLLAAACLAGLVVATEVLGYPRSMVGVPGALETNNTPPTIALFLLAGLQVGVVVAALVPLTRWLERPGVWAFVTLLGRRALTIFLWHQTALVTVVGATFPSGIWPVTDRVDAAWWLTRPLWYVTLGSVLAVLVAVFGRVEGASAALPERWLRPAVLPRVVVGIVATVTGLSWLVLEGLYDPSGLLTVRLVPLAAVAVGAWALGLLDVRRVAGQPPSAGAGVTRPRMVRERMGAEPRTAHRPPGAGNRDGDDARTGPTGGRPGAE